MATKGEREKLIKQMKRFVPNFIFWFFINWQKNKKQNNKILMLQEAKHLVLFYLKSEHPKKTFIQWNHFVIKKTFRCEIRTRKRFLKVMIAETQSGIVRKFKLKRVKRSWVHIRGILLKIALADLGPVAAQYWWICLWNVTSNYSQNFFLQTLSKIFFLKWGLGSWNV